MEELGTRRPPTWGVLDRVILCAVGGGEGGARGAGRALLAPPHHGHGGQGESVRVRGLAPPHHGHGVKGKVCVYGD
eukprot:54419-Prorocentrum_minimum.AAC.1